MIYTTYSIRLQEYLAEFEKGLHKSRASLYTQQLRETDKERSDAAVTLVNLIRAYGKSRDKNSQAAYQLLAPLMKNYQQLTENTYEKKTEAINHLVNQLREEVYQNALAQLYLSVQFEHLVQAQSHFDGVYSQRIQEQASKTPGKIRETRGNLVESYNFIIDYTAIMAYGFPEKTEFAQLRKQLNTIRSRYKVRKPDTKDKNVAIVKEEVLAEKE